VVPPMSVRHTAFLKDDKGGGNMVTARPTRQLPAETSPVVLIMAARREAGLDRNITGHQSSERLVRKEIVVYR
jgi:hypothetical protein